MDPKSRPGSIEAGAATAGGADAMRQEEELLRFRTALDMSADSIWLIDRETMRFIDVNRTACERFGYTREELLTMGPPDLSPNQGQEFAGDYDHIIAGDITPTISERTLRHKDGTLIPIEARRGAVKSGGRWIIVGISRDLTERVAAGRALRESNEGFLTLAEAMPQIGRVCAPDGSCTYMNQRWVENTGIVQTAINLAHNLNLRAVAEGVETADQWELILGHGCDAAQGDYISPPLDAAACTKMLHEGVDALVAHRIARQR